MLHLTLPSTLPSAARRASSRTVCSATRQSRRLHTKRGAATMAATADVPSIPAIFDIFDAPARMIDHEVGSSSRTSSFLRSPFSSPAPRAAKGKTSKTSANAMTGASSSSTSLANYTQPKALLFDGPARPRHRIVVTSRHRQASTTSAMTVAYVPPEPEVFDGPSRPRRRTPVAYPKRKPMAVSTHGLLFAGIMSLFGLTTYEAQKGDRRGSSLRRSIGNPLVSR